MTGISEVSVVTYALVTIHKQDTIALTFSFSLSFFPLTIGILDTFYESTSVYVLL